MTVSYVLTVYNKAPFLPAVLAAVAAERSETGGEIVVVDDGSTDNSGTILDDFARTGSAITILHQPNGGVAKATNVALGAAREPFVRLIDGDDIILRGTTRLLLRVLEETGRDYAFGRFGDYDLGQTQDDFPAAGEEAAIVPVKDPLAEMIRMQFFVVSASLGRKAAYDRALPLPEQYYIQDTSLGLQLATTAAFVRVDEFCCHMPRSAPGRVSSAKARMFRDSVLIVRDLQGSWPSRYRALAVRRNAGRAYHYVRRHIPGSRLRCAELLGIRLLSYLPIEGVFSFLLERIARTYDGAA